MKFCARCNQERSGNRFCATCGGPLTDSGSGATPPGGPLTAADDTGTYTIARTPGADERPGGRGQPGQMPPGASLPAADDTGTYMIARTPGAGDRSRQETQLALPPDQGQGAPGTQSAQETQPPPGTQDPQGGQASPVGGLSGADAFATQTVLGAGGTQAGQYQPTEYQPAPGAYSGAGQYTDPGPGQGPPSHQGPGQYQEPSRYQDPTQYQGPAHYRDPAQFQGGGYAPGPGTAPFAPAPGPGRRRGGRTTALVAAAVVVVIAAGAGAYALASSLHHPGTSAGPTTSPSAVTSAPPASASASAPATPSASAAPATPTPKPTATGPVPFAAGVSGNPAAQPVENLFTTYFAGINAHDYNQYASTLTPAEQANQTQSQFASGYATTVDSDEEINSITGSGASLAVVITFTSRQSANDSPDHSACNGYTLTLPLERSGSGYLIAPPPKGYASWTDC